jgi:hypothetical protein
LLERAEQRPECLGSAFTYGQVQSIVQEGKVLLEMLVTEWPLLVKKPCGHYQEWHLSQAMVNDGETMKNFIAAEEKEPCSSCMPEVDGKARPALCTLLPGTSAITW